MLKCPAKVFFFVGGTHGSPVKMSGEAQNHFAYSEFKTKMSKNFSMVIATLAIKDLTNVND